jgi:drug/metabolite transporter (DMT)-like permease
MSFPQIILLVGIAIMMSIGQVLLKITAGRISGASLLSADLFVDRYFLAAIVIYGAAALLWIVALRESELSRAHPFIIISFVITPLLAWGLLGESISWRYAFGLCLVLVGLAVISRS